MKINTVFLSLEQMIRRLNAMSSSDQVSNEAKDEIITEVKVLDWIRLDLLGDMTKLAIVIGDSRFIAPFISELTSISRHQATTTNDKEFSKTISSGDLTISTVVAPTDRIFRKFCDLYDHKLFEGSSLSEELLLDYIVCNEYYMAMDDEENKRALLFNLSMRTQYLSKLDECVEWVKAAFVDLSLDGLEQNQ